MRLTPPATLLRFGALAAACALFTVVPCRANDDLLHPPASAWARKAPAEVGMDAAKLDAAVAFAKAHEMNIPKDFSTQEKIFGSLLGPIPNDRAATNGVIIRRGYVVAEFGETNRADPTYSVAKSMLSTVAAVAVRDGLIKDLDSPVGATVRDGGYETPRNASSPGRTTSSRSRSGKGEMWGKKDDFVGTIRDSADGHTCKPRAADGGPAPSTNTTTSASTACRSRCSGCSRSPFRTCSATRSVR